MNKENTRLILRTTYLAIVVSVVLAVAKFTNYFFTNSMAIHASALDSLMDICVAFANFAAIKITLKKPNKKFPYGYDKIAALAAFLQVILIAFFAIHLIQECFERLFHPEAQMHNFGLAFAIIAFSIILNGVLILYQARVVKKTGSIVIKASMFHYETDLFTSVAIFLGVLSIWAFNVSWLDPIIGTGSALYLLISVVSLAKIALASILDMNDSKKTEKIRKILAENGVNLKDFYVRVLFSGTKLRVQILVNENAQIDKTKIEEIISGHFENSVTEFILQ